MRASGLMTAAAATAGAPDRKVIVSFVSCVYYTGVFFIIQSYDSKKTEKKTCFLIEKYRKIIDKTGNAVLGRREAWAPDIYLRRGSKIILTCVSRCVKLKS